MKVTVAALLVLVAFVASAIAEPVPVQGGNPLEQPGQWSGGQQQSGPWNGQQQPGQWNGGSQQQQGVNGGHHDNAGEPATGIVQNIFGMFSGLFRGLGNMISGIIQTSAHHNNQNNNNNNNNNPVNGGSNAPGAVSAVSGPQGNAQPSPFNTPIGVDPNQVQSPFQPQPIGAGPSPVQPFAPLSQPIGNAGPAGQQPTF